MQALSKKERTTIEKIYGSLPQVPSGKEPKLLSRKQLMLLFTNLMYHQILAILKEETFAIPFVGDMVSVSGDKMIIKLSPFFQRSLQKFQTDQDCEVEEMILSEIMSILKDNL